MRSDKTRLDHLAELDHRRGDVVVAVEVARERSGGLDWTRSTDCARAQHSHPATTAPAATPLVG